MLTAYPQKCSWPWQRSPVSLLRNIRYVRPVPLRLYMLHASCSFSQLSSIEISQDRQIITGPGIEWTNNSMSMLLKLQWAAFVEQLCKTKG